ncbi:MAG: type II toxin-antitoxin system RelE/ParE family toxin [Pyrinomonadaceae bacterium]
MTVGIGWTAPAFAQLEALPQSLAFEIVRRVGVLIAFPEAGARVQSADPGLKSCRQLIVRRSHRVVYDYDETEGAVYILAVQHCRQRLPSGRDLKRRQPPEDG